MRNSFLVLMSLVLVCSGCSKKGSPSPSPNPNPVPTPTPTPTGPNEMDVWMTRGDQSMLLQKQTGNLAFADITNAYSNIEVDSAQGFQTVDGFGYTLTGASAYLLRRMDANSRASLLTELFSQSNGIGVSYLRLSIGASDLSTDVFSYDDMPTGQTDPTLASFSLSKDTVDLIPVLREILSINPSIKILGSPWSAPVWMKDNGNTMGGGLQTQYYAAYAKYFVKYIQAMANKGITIDAVTIQNEPQHGGNNPSMVLSAAQEADFVKNHLGPQFQANAISTKIIVWDHNCDNPNYPIAILNDPAAKAFINGSAFHLYGGDISALSTVYNAHPDKALYFTEQWTSSTGSFAGDLQWHVKNVVIGSMRNWSRNALEWNLANDPSFSLHTPGGCTQCKGALTINGSSVERNVAYYIIAHASKFVPAGSVRIASTALSALPNAAFRTPAGKKVLIVVNDSNATQGFNISYKSKKIFNSLAPGAVATYTW